jgi:hypothetical protein
MNDLAGYVIGVMFTLASIARTHRAGRGVRA